MLQVSFIRENKEEVINGLKKRNFKEIELVEKAIEIDQKRRNTQAELDQTLSKNNSLSKEIGQLIKQGKKQEAEKIKNETAQTKELIKELEEKLNLAIEELQEVLYKIPNVPNKIVPEGLSAQDNVEVFKYGEIPQLPLGAMPHWELAKKYDIIDFEMGVKLTGAGFPVYKAKGAKLQRALISYFLDKNTEAGYREYEVPIMVNEDSGYGTGQLPDKEGQMYFVGLDNLYLVPTAEVPLTNMFRDVILQESQLPVCCTAYTPCFRREAGSYGANVRGLNRLHQFDKVEIVRIEHPQKSYQALDQMVEHVKGIMKELELPFRIIRLCGGDMGFTSALTYDFEVYSTSQEKWLEISSVSNFETFQANRLKLRFKDKDGKIQLAHTLNGSSLALPRVLAGILENYQREDKIEIPKALRKYTGFDYID